MQLLFEIKTDRVVLRWQGPRQQAKDADLSTTPGLLKVVSRRSDLQVNILRPSLPEGIKTAGVEVTEGSRLLEETAYHVSVYSTNNTSVELKHRDPTLLSAVIPTKPEGDSLAGTLNFRGQVGTSTFSVFVDGSPEFDFTVEVFPSKIDYKTDYDQMMADITSILTGLALEYLRATYRLGQQASVPEPNKLEWLILLRNVLGDLEGALRRISRRPQRKLVRDDRYVRPERIRRVDGAVRRAVGRGQGRGGRQVLAETGFVRQYVRERRPIETLDTPEHRWLRVQLADIRYKLSDLAQAEREWGKETGQRKQQALSEMTGMENRLSQLLRLEPINAATGEPPPGFSSLLLQSGDGYREAYLNCLVLRMGLKLEGGPLELSQKDIAVLYEYWCYLAMARLVAEETGAQIEAARIFKVTAQGLHVNLERGGGQQIQLKDTLSQHVKKATLTYNPSHDTATGRQRPDVGLSLAIDGWKTPFELIVDAKYRLDTSPAYVQRNETPGPPEDAVNVLHRYRDAILSKSQKRSVIMGAALFPYQDKENRYHKNKFFGSLSEVGIGALPFLPGRQEYVKGWLRDVLKQSGWQLSERVTEHQNVTEKLEQGDLARQMTLVVPVTPEELDWLIEHRVYHVPLNRLGARRFAVQWLAFQLPSGERGGAPAITHQARVHQISVVRLGDRRTPVSPWSNLDDQYLQYAVDVPVALPKVFRDQGLRGMRWTSQLSLRRASQGWQLFLETEPEWRLHDAFKAQGIEFLVRPGKAVLMDPSDIRGRAIFLVSGCSVVYQGAAGFQVDTGNNPVYLPTVGDVIGLLKEKRAACAPLSVS